jgi:hypothetical protein
MISQDTVKSKTMTVETAHNRLGHMSDEATRNTARHLGWSLQRRYMPPCESCAIGKARQANVCKHSKAEPAMLYKSRAYLDCCTLKDRESNTTLRKTWRILVIYPSQYKISDMFPSKSTMVEPTVIKLNKLHQINKCPSYLRMDNAGENLLLK